MYLLSDLFNFEVLVIYKHGSWWIDQSLFSNLLKCILALFHVLELYESLFGKDTQITRSGNLSFDV